MKSSGLQEAIVAHLRAASRPESSRDLARRFLRIEQGEEETCRRLLAPVLLSVPGVVHRPGEGWSILTRATPVPTSAPTGARAARALEADAAETEAAPAGAIEVGADSPRDFVALASDGAGPGGSGAVRAVSLLPVVAGEACDEEHLPSWGLDAEGSVPIETIGLEREDLETLAELVGDLPVVCHRVAREVEPLRRACAASGVPFHPRVISAAKLGHLLLGLKANHAAIDLAASLGLEARGPDDCRGRVRIVADAYLRLLALLEERGIDTLEALVEYQEMPPAPLDLTRYAFTAEDLRALPARPGVYRFLDRDSAVIYVGKSKNLRARLGSYFAPAARGTEKGRAILEQIHSFRVDLVASDLEAALLEAALIAECRPRLNRQFEVHERPAPYGPRLNLAVVLRDAPSPEAPAAVSLAGTCTVHLLRGGRYLGRVAGIGPAGESLRNLRRLLARGYFSRPAGKRDAAPDHDIDWQLVGSYLRKHRDEVSVLDVDELASPEEAVERLRVLVAAALEGVTRVVAR